MGPLPRTLTGKRYIILAIDWFTKWPEAKAIESADAQTIAAFYTRRYRPTRSTETVDL